MIFYRNYLGVQEEFCYNEILFLSVSLSFEIDFLFGWQFEGVWWWVSQVYLFWYVGEMVMA